MGRAQPADRGSSSTRRPCRKRSHSPWDQTPASSRFPQLRSHCGRRCAARRSIIQFGPYNVIIHANPQYRRADFPFEPSSGPKAEAYERRIRVILNAIGHTKVGRVLLSSLISWVPVYIVPYAANDCNALTGQLTSDLMKGVRIQFSPETWAFNACGRIPGYRPVESLFHEMVHASRITNLGAAGLESASLRDMKDPEEFLAVMITNVFRSEQGAQKFSRDYQTGRVVSQAQLEAFLASRRDLLDALDKLLSDDLVKDVARMKTPFNPFRDLDRLRGIPSRPSTSWPHRVR
jgi:hypothetical protein